MASTFTARPRDAIHLSTSLLRPLSTLTPFRRPCLLPTRNNLSVLPTRTRRLSIQRAGKKKVPQDEIEIKGYTPFRPPEWDNLETKIKIFYPDTNATRILTLKQALRTLIKEGTGLQPYSAEHGRSRSTRSPYLGGEIPEFELCTLSYVGDPLTDRPLVNLRIPRWRSGRQYRRSVGALYYLLKLNRTVVVSLVASAEQFPDFKKQVARMPHLRPDVLLRSMPEGTEIKIKPHTGTYKGTKMVSWVFARGGSFEACVEQNITSPWGDDEQDKEH